MRTTLVSSVIGMAALASMAAGPYLNPDNVDFRQDLTRLVTIRYDLENAPAIVTVDIQTNAGNNVWISIGDRNFTTIAGDVNKVVQQGTGRLITWNPRLDLPPVKLVGGNVARAVLTAWSLESPPDYMVIDLDQDANAGATDNVRYYVSTNALPDGGLANDKYRTSHLVMRRIPAAGVTWRMGSPVGEYNRSANEVPHLVTLTEDYFMAIYEFTMAQWNRISPTGDKANASMLPRNNCSYNTIRGSGWPSDGNIVPSTSYMGYIRSRTGIDTFDLPTEAQWEYACRAGTETGWPTGYDASDATALRQFAVYYYTASGARQNVGTLAPNKWGLYDMIGNVGEFCLDWFGDYDISDDVDPTGPATGSKRVRRGSYCEQGSFGDFSSAKRASWAPDSGYGAFGFRPVCGAIVTR